jgi:hypothetical protein
MEERLDGGAVREIERLVKQGIGAGKIEIEGKSYSTVPLHDPRTPEPVPDALKFSTLESLVEYAKREGDSEFQQYTDDRGLFVHVAGPTTVRLLTDIFGEHNQRATLAVAEAIVPNLGLGSFIDPESFNIALQAFFEPTEARAQVLRLVGNLQTEAVQTVSDDGVSQQATASRGLARRADVAVPNPVVLRPFRTFAEVSSPESTFVLRLRGGGEGRLPTCALFEADGGQWRLKAIESVKLWLNEKLGPEFDVFG